jgi:hypothetical protein
MCFRISMVSGSKLFENVSNFHDKSVAAILPSWTELCFEISRACGGASGVSFFSQIR